jgi:hypothetical protein
MAAYPVASTTWSETTLTGNTRPPTGSALGDVTVPNATPAWYEFNVTSWLKGELAAGRTTGALALKNLTVSSSRVRLNSRQAGSNRPELVVADGGGTPPPTSRSDVVIYATDAAVIRGNWAFVADATAAGGSRLHNPDASAPKVAAPAASPNDYFDITFTAEAQTGYRLWIRGKADRDAYWNDSAYVQFSDSVTATGAAVYRIGTTTATTYVLEDCSGCGERGWGWQDNGYGTNVFGPLIYFAGSGTHTIRIQAREDGLSIDQIVLSPERYLSVAPGATKNDTTIVPR